MPVPTVAEVGSLRGIYIGIRGCIRFSCSSLGFFTFDGSAQNIPESTSDCLLSFLDF